MWSGMIWEWSNKQSCQHPECGWFDNWPNTLEKINQCLRYLDPTVYIEVKLIISFSFGFEYPIYNLYITSALTEIMSQLC